MDMANFFRRIIQKSKNTRDASPVNIPASSSGASKGRRFTFKKSPKEQSASPAEDFDSRVDNGESLNDIYPIILPEEVSPRSSFQAYAKSRMKLNTANHPHSKQNNAISSNKAASIRGSGQLRYPSCANCYSSGTQQTPEMYNPVYLGPHITVSSADGTSVRPDIDCDDEMEDKAALLVYRALTAREKRMREHRADERLDMIIGAIDIAVQKREVAARRSVQIVEGPEIQPHQGVLEWADELDEQDGNVVQNSEGIFRRVSTNMKRSLSEWRRKLLVSSKREEERKREQLSSSSGILLSSSICMY